MSYPPSYSAMVKTQNNLSQLLEQEQYAAAWEYYVEHQDSIPRERRGFFFACIQDGLSGRLYYRRVLNTAVAMLLVNLLITPIFYLQLVDFFALLSHHFFYYNYYIKLLPLLVNVVFIICLVYQWHTWVVLPRKLFGRQIKPIYSNGYFFLMTLTAFYMCVQFTPLMQDLPMVLEGKYYTRSISYVEEVAMVYGEIIRTTDRPDVAAVLRQELLEKYGLDYSEDDFPVHYSRQSSRMGREVRLIYLDAEGEAYVMSKAQFNATTFDTNLYPIVIKYLRHSKIILQIVNE